MNRLKVLTLIALVSCQSTQRTEVPVLLESHPFSVHDMLAMERIGDAQVSPDGRFVAYTLRKTDMAANKGRTDVHIAATDGSKSRRLTSDPASDFNARWMPGGDELVFLSTRGGSSQIWSLSEDGGAPRQVTDLPLDVGNLHVFPDGERLAFTMDVYPDAATLAETAARDAQRADAPVKARVYDSLMHRHWDTWEDGKRTHVFVWKIGGGEPIDLMAGMDVDCPHKPFGGGDDIAISPDGSEVILVAKDEDGRDAWSTNVDLWSVPSDGSASPKRITDDNEAYDSSPVFSPDGGTLAYLAMARPGYEADKLNIVLVDSDGGRRVLTEAWDRSVGGFAWSADGATIYANASNLGHRSLFAIDVASGDVRTLVEKGTNGAPAPFGDRLLFARDTLKSPVELYSVATDGSDLRPVTHVNDARVAVARMGDYEQFTFEGANGDVVHGFVMKPADYVEGEKYPVAFLIHGGPQGSFGDHFHYRWNPQAYAGAGYASIFIDFHGSSGYGQAFMDSINQDWGGKPYQDLMKGLDHALAAYPYLDGDRVAALGASYGGYMINWIAGQTDRFRCLVNHDGVFNTRHMYFDTEELWFPEWDHGGTPWENPGGFSKHNPVDHVQNWKTPMLVIQGALDYRVVDTQALGAFTALQRQGVPSRLLYFPDENHWILKPQNSVFWHQTVLDWIDQWTK